MIVAPNSPRRPMPRLSRGSPGAPAATPHGRRFGAPGAERPRPPRPALGSTPANAATAVRIERPATKASAITTAAWVNGTDAESAAESPKRPKAANKPIPRLRAEAQRQPEQRRQERGPRNRA